jgi:hypothetical protein
MSHNTRLKHLAFDSLDEFVLDVPVETDVTRPHGPVTPVVRHSQSEKITLTSIGLY